MTQVAALDLGADGLAITWADGAKRSRDPWLWLRDHGHVPATLHPATLQRQLDTAAVPDDIHGTAARLADDGRTVEVVWSTGEQSRFPLAFLWQFRVPRSAAGEAAPARIHWDAATIAAQLPRVAHDDVMAADGGLERWLEGVETYGFCLVEDVPPTAEASAALVRRIGYLRETIFGALWDFTADLAKADTAYTTLELRPHTDGTYALDAPGLQFFHCLAFSGQGGESVLVDGFRIADELRRDDPAAYATLATIEVTGQYIGDGAHLMATRPVFRHEHGRLVQVTFNNYDRAPFRLPEPELQAFYQALRAFERLANSPRLQWIHPLRPGEVLLFDNWRTLHGRKAYEGTRRLCGAYLNREDFDSRLRLLRQPADAPDHRQ
jgi:trimethyllysine dioxygenase